MQTKSEEARPDESGTQVPPARFLAGFMPLRSLWEGPGAMYPGEQSVRHARRSLGPDLARAEAVARVGNQLMVHPERWAQVAQRRAISDFQQFEAAREGRQS